MALGVGVVLVAGAITAEDRLGDFAAPDSCEELAPCTDQIPPAARTALEAAGLTDLPPNGYLSIDVLLAIYTHSFLDTLSPSDLDHILSEVQQTREFYARNTRCLLDINIADIAVIDRLLTIEQFELSPGGMYRFPYWEVDGVHSVREDLYSLGYTDGQFASVFVFYAWAYHDSYPSLGGSAWRPSPSFMDSTAYASQAQKQHDPETNDLYFIHEFLHNLDRMFELSGLPDFPHPDLASSYNQGVFDDGYSFDAWVLGGWPRDGWALMSPRWGTVLTFVDADGDSLPDSNPSLAFDEVRFGSSASAIDTDLDGLNDLDELASGYNSSADPNVIDTDGDGLFDGEDPYPLDAVKPYLYQGGMVLDGALDNPPPPYLTSFGTDDQSDLWVDLYACYDDTGLYFLFDVTDDSVSYRNIYIKWKEGIRIRIDGLTDGYYHHGDDNYEITVVPEGDPTDPLRRLELKRDDGSNSTTLIPASDLKAAYSLTSNGYVVEIFIKENHTWGLFVNEGSPTRIQFDVLDYDIDIGWPAGFPRYEAFSRFVSFNYDQTTDVGDSSYAQGLPLTFMLSQNYPNPFNPVTTINYTLPRRNHVTVDIFNIVGQRVRTLIDMDKPSGSHSITWDALNESGAEVAAGLYVYRFRAGDHIETKKMLLLK
ncbi:MAG: FlgD immunoglobulin-like domain containing protein [Candidatus Thorarchaeota archaeon]